MNDNKQSSCFALTSNDLLCRPSVIEPFYQDESITIYNADCAQILPFLPTFDLLLTDPPYGVGYNTSATKGRGTSSKKWKNGRTKDYGVFEWDVEIESWLLEIMKAKGKLQIIWGGNYYDLPKCKQWLVWDKETNGAFADCELAWTNLSGTTRIKKHLWNGFAREGNEARFHPTQKPLALMKWCLSLVPEAKTILDPFFGSGTTLRAAKDLGLQAVGIERDERYCQIAVERLRQRTLGF